MKKRLLILLALLLMPLLSLLSSCTYTAPFRRVEEIPEGSSVLVTLTAVEHRAGKRSEFFRDTKSVLAELPNQTGLIGYSFRFQIFGKKAWTMTAWKDEQSRDRFASTPTHMQAVRNSRNTAQNMRFTSIRLPVESLPLKWKEALELLEKAPAYE